ncbi:MAG: winged helix-turn-helix domain-containing protein, partial [Bacteroidales bacterium]|nr:winged helix-turn-helix domain-containing protein [Bacteroidales bacterium]
MSKFLSSEEQQELKQRRRKEKDGRIDEETISKHVSEYQENKKLEIKTGGSHSKLSPGQTEELNEHLMEHTYAKVSEICEHVKEKYEISYSVQGMTCWLKNHGFSYKKPQPTPSKA